MKKEVKRLLSKAFEAKKTGYVRNNRCFEVPYDKDTVLAVCIYSLGYIPESNLHGEIIGYGKDIYEEDADGDYLYCGYEPVVRFSKDEMHVLDLAGLN